MFSNERENSCATVYNCYFLTILFDPVQTKDSILEIKNSFILLLLSTNTDLNNLGLTLALRFVNLLIGNKVLPS
jgi:hypothetical protein